MCHRVIVTISNTYCIEKSWECLSSFDTWSVPRSIRDRDPTVVWFGRLVQVVLLIAKLKPNSHLFSFLFSTESPNHSSIKCITQSLLPILGFRLLGFSFPLSLLVYLDLLLSGRGLDRDSRSRAEADPVWKEFGIPGLKKNTLTRIKTLRFMTPYSIPISGYSKSLNQGWLES